MPIIITEHTTPLRSGLMHTGTAGDDLFVPTDQVDTFRGGGGVDTVSYEDSPVGLVISGTDGQPVIGYDLRILDRFEDISVIRATDHPDFIVTADFADTSVTLFGGGGNDHVGIEVENSTLYGGDGGDYLDTDGRDNHLFGGDGDDWLLVYADGDQFLYGGAGSDAFDLGKFDNSTVFGGAGDDLVMGQGNDVGLLIYGDEGSDRVTVGDGDDLVYGGAGHDSLRGNDGDDLLSGGDGNDILYDRFGANTLEGGAGNDAYFAYDMNVSKEGVVTQHTIVEELGYSDGGGIDTVFSNRHFILPENVEVLRLVSTAKFGEGNAAPNVIVASPNGSNLFGWGGNDRLIGGFGNDRLTGGAGQDTLTGGAGEDMFRYTKTSESGRGQEARDFIVGFEQGVDKILLSGLVHRGEEVAGLDFVGTDVFTGMVGEVRVQGTGGHNAVIVEVDASGDGLADLQILVNGTDFMSVGDFLL